MAVTSFYTKKTISNVEVATLANSIKLPKYDKVLTAAMVKTMVAKGTGTFTPKSTVYKSVIGEFYIAVEIPTLDKSEVIDNINAAPITMQGGNKLNTSIYRTGNTIRLEIPKYLVMMFDNEIPKGTMFLIASLGEAIDANNIRIISLYNETPDQLIDSELLDGTTTTRVLGGGR